MIDMMMGVMERGRWLPTVVKGDGTENTVTL